MSSTRKQSRDAPGSRRGSLIDALRGFVLFERGIVGIAVGSAPVERFLPHQPVQRSVFAQALHKIRIGDERRPNETRSARPLATASIAICQS